MATPNLIYDVGVHDGEDTAYYLHKGFNVVGIEANPEMVAAVKRRFDHAIAQGTLQLVEVGVADREGYLNFYVCNESSDWSSFNPNKAASGGFSNKVVEVKTTKFSTILRRYGVPYYCKIDIEGHDPVCLRGIDPNDKPQFISIEMSHTIGDRDIATLRDLGYNRFKIISQSNFAPANVLLDKFARSLPKMVTWRVRRLEGKFLGRLSDGSWNFRMGSSGPFGDELPGSWHSYEDTVKTWKALHDLDKRHFGGNWFDVHAGV
ncbi:FkbM family methyltransferase [Bradyrhizobium sp. USDA 4471]